MTGSPFTVYTTCPASTVDSPKQYLTRLRDVSRWTEAAGCRGFLVYADNSLTDVWLTAQTVIERTDTLVPMVAVQPVYTHPYAVAKAVASLAWLHERQVDLNLITGGFAKHLAELGDPLREDHDGRYRRLREFASSSVTFSRRNRRPFFFTATTTAWTRRPSIPLYHPLWHPAYSFPGTRRRAGR